MNNKKAILVVSSGTSNIKARKENIETVENKIASHFTDYQLRRAFSSLKIRDKIKVNEGVVIDSPSEALRKLAVEGFREIVVQPLQIIPGMEYEKLIAEVEQHRRYFNNVIIGKPLLYNEEDYLTVVKALNKNLSQLKFKEAAVLMGHGSSHSAQKCYSTLQKYIDEAGLSAYIGTIKGMPGISDIVKGLKEEEIKKVMLMPFMLVAGNHALFDMASDEEYSWKSILLKEGFLVDIYLKGLGEDEGYQDMYVNKIRKAMRGIEDSTSR